MVSKTRRPRNKDLYRQPVNPKFAVSFLFIFAALVGIYLAANFKCCLEPAAVSPVFPARSVADVREKDPAGETKAELKSFISADDFKSYLDDGKRAYSGGNFENQDSNLEAAKLPQKNATAKNPAPKNAKIQKSEIDDLVSETDARKFFSLGNFRELPGFEIIKHGSGRLYFSPESQYYLPAAAAADAAAGQDIPAGETKIIDISGEQMDQPGFAPRDGRLLQAPGFLGVMNNNLLAGYDTAVFSYPREIWTARVHQGSAVIAAKESGSKIFLALKTKIDPANPCPIKPLDISDKPLVVQCAAIQHPQKTILAEAIYTVIEIDTMSGQAGKSVSFLGQNQGAGIVFGENDIYAFWSENRDYVALFADFLTANCKSLAPNYLLEKAADLPEYNITLTAKEMEMRALVSNWIGSLGQDEQTRIAGEISSRMKDYLRSHYRDFDQTGIAAAKLSDLKFYRQALVSGIVPAADFLDERQGNLRAVTVSGRGFAQKMDWLVTGKNSPEDPQKVLNNAYVFGPGLVLAGEAPDLDLPAAVCAVNYGFSGAVLRTCRAQDPYYSINLAAPLEPSGKGQIKLAGSPSYLVFLDASQLLAVFKNNRKIKLELIDVSLAARPEKKSEYDLNDYWADFDGNYRAFAADKDSKKFFLPAARGGYIFSYADGKLAEPKTIGDFPVDRAFFWNGYLYLAGPTQIDVYGGGDWSKIKSAVF